MTSMPDKEDDPWKKAQEDPVNVPMFEQNAENETWDKCNTTRQLLLGQQEDVNQLDQKSAKAEALNQTDHDACPSTTTCRRIRFQCS